MPIIYLKLFVFVDEGILNGLDLGRDDGEHRYVDPVELVKTAPGPTLTETREQFPNSLCMNTGTEGHTKTKKKNYHFCLTLYNLFSHT